MLLPNQSRFRGGALAGWWLAGLACSSAFGQDFEKQTTAALDRDRTLHVVHSTNIHAGRKLFADALRPDVSQATLGSARRRPTFTETCPPPIGVVVGPFKADLFLRMDSSTAGGRVVPWISWARAPIS